MAAFSIRRDAAYIAGVVLAGIALMLSFVNVSFSEYGFRVELYPALMPGWSGKDIEDGLSFLAALLLFVGMIALKSRSQCLCVIVSLVLYLLAFFLYALHYADNPIELLLSLFNPNFIIAVMPFAISLAGAAWVLMADEDKSTVLLVVALISAAIALLLTFLKVIPFGSDFCSTRYLSTFLRYSATWLCIPIVSLSIAMDAYAGKRGIASARMEGARDEGIQIIDLRRGAETVKELKELLDMDAITEEEYEAKKRELLGL